MKRSGIVWVLGMALALVGTGIAQAGEIDGVITSYISGNQGTDMTVRTSDGRNHRLWFDNMRKPLFQGKALPWCPDFPCTGWPIQLLMNRTRVRVFTVNANAGGHMIQTPTQIELLH
ncbi:MAG TPA: hypothetical protein VIN40_11120 [Candidatus Tyrphobacter sp.]